MAETVSLTDSAVDGYTEMNNSNRQSLTLI